MWMGYWSKLHAYVYCRLPIKKRARRRAFLFYHIALREPPKNRSEWLSNKAHGAQKVRHTVRGRRTFEHRDTPGFVFVATFLLLRNTLFQTHGHAAIQSRSRLLEVPFQAYFQPTLLSSCFGLRQHCQQSWQAQSCPGERNQGWRLTPKAQCRQRLGIHHCLPRSISVLARMLGIQGT